MESGSNKVIKYPSASEFFAWGLLLAIMASVYYFNRAVAFIGFGASIGVLYLLTISMFLNLAVRSRGVWSSAMDLSIPRALEVIYDYGIPKVLYARPKAMDIEYVLGMALLSFLILPIAVHDKLYEESFSNNIPIGALCFFCIYGQVHVIFDLIIAFLVKMKGTAKLN